MKSPKNNSSNTQHLFFDKIKQQIPVQNSLVECISELLGISNDAAYRRIRGEKQMDFNEIAALSSHFNISIDSLLNIESNQLLFQYTPLDLNDLDNYLVYLKQFSNNIHSLRVAKNKHITATAVDIPIFHFMPYKELTLFKIYTWANSIYNYKGSFNNFLQEIEKDELLDKYKQIAEDYKLIPSSEIWTENTIDTILRLIDFYFEVGYFKTDEYALLICSQLLDLVSNLQDWAETGTKCPNSESSNFDLYISDTDLENNIFILEKDDMRICTLKLFTINSITTTSPLFCAETEEWVKNAMRRGVLVSGASQKERYKLFNMYQQKIRYLIDKIEKSGNAMHTSFQNKSFI